MGFSPINYSLMFDDINQMTTKKDVIRELKVSTGKPKKYLEKLYDISQEKDGTLIWYIDDLEKFFNMSLKIIPFFRPEFFIPGWDFNVTGNQGYVTPCGLKKMILILSVMEHRIIE